MSQGLRVELDARVFGRRAHRKLVHVGLAEGNRARRLQLRDHGRVKHRPVIAQDARGAGAGLPATLIASLIASGIPPNGRLTSAASACASAASRVARKVGADFWLERFDSLLQRLEHFPRRDFARPQKLLQFDNRQAGKIARRHSITLVHDEETVRGAGRVAQCFLLRQAGSGLVGAQDIELRRGVRRRFDALEIEVLEPGGVIQDLRELRLEKRRLFRAQLKPGEAGDVGDIEIGWRGHQAQLTVSPRHCHPGAGRRIKN